MSTNPGQQEQKVAKGKQPAGTSRTPSPGAARPPTASAAAPPASQAGVRGAAPSRRIPQGYEPLKTTSESAIYAEFDMRMKRTIARTREPRSEHYHRVLAMDLCRFIRENWEAWIQHEHFPSSIFGNDGPSRKSSEAQMVELNEVLRRLNSLQNPPVWLEPTDRADVVLMRFRGNLAGRRLTRPRATHALVRKHLHGSEWRVERSQIDNAGRRASSPERVPPIRGMAPAEPRLLVARPSAFQQSTRALATSVVSAPEARFAIIGAAQTGNPSTCPPIAVYNFKLAKHPTKELSDECLAAADHQKCHYIFRKNGSLVTRADLSWIPGRVWTAFQDGTNLAAYKGRTSLLQGLEPSGGSQSTNSPRDRSDINMIITLLEHNNLVDKGDRFCCAIWNSESGRFVWRLAKQWFPNLNQ